MRCIINNNKTAQFGVAGHNILNSINIAENYLRLLERIEKSANSAVRDAQDVKLVVVTKGHPIDSVLQAYDAGIRIFGENYVQEAVAKIEALGLDEDIEWHMIGHIQSRKARNVSKYFHWVQSLDSLKLARRLDRFSAEEERLLPVLLEFNVSGEESKFGIPAWNEKSWNDLLPDLEHMVGLPNLEIWGLMTMPPLAIDPQKVRPYFVRLRKLQSFLRLHLPQISWNELSMGMSGDYEIAVQEGATIVRVGTAIMGPRIQH